MEYTTKDVRRLLRMVRTRLLNGKITKKQFNMSDVLETTSCGTVGCIGGWCLAIAGKEKTRMGDIDSLVNRPDGPVKNGYTGLMSDDLLNDLFYNYPNPDRITPARGAAAITRYLDGKTRHGGNSPHFPQVPG